MDGTEPGLIPNSEALDPRCFALRPLCNDLLSREMVPVQPLKDDGTLGEAKDTSFAGIDLDVWATHFLADVDRIFPAPYTTISDSETLAKVVAAKESLAEAVAVGLDFVLEPGRLESKARQIACQAARELLKQHLLINFRQAWETGVIVQYDVPGVDMTPSGMPASCATFRIHSRRLRTGDPEAARMARFGTLPVPLRIYPLPVCMVSQTAEPVAPETLDWRQAARWRYSFRFRHASAIQDQFGIEVLFSVGSVVMGKVVAETDDLFSALAQYQAVRDRLWERLKELLDPPSDAVSEILVNALNTYSDLAKRVTDQWQAHWESATRTSVASDHSNHVSRMILAPTRQRFTGTLLSSPCGDVYDAFRLSMDETMDLPRWPEMTIFTPGGETLTLRPNTSGNATTYTFPEGSKVAIGTALIIQMTFDNLHVAMHENAISQVRVVRNAHLFGPMGPVTRDAFIYRTPMVSFSDPMVPCLRHAQRLSIGVWDAQGTPLDVVLQELTRHGKHLIQLEAQYECQLSPGGPSTAVPALFIPCREYTGQEAQAIATQLASWKKVHAPEATGGCWKFGLTLYSALETDHPLPLFEVHDLVSTCC